MLKSLWRKSSIRFYLSSLSHLPSGWLYWLYDMKKCVWTALAVPITEQTGSYKTELCKLWKCTPPKRCQGFHYSLNYLGRWASWRAFSTSMSSLSKSTRITLKFASLVFKYRLDMSEINCWTQRAWFFTARHERFSTCSRVLFRGNVDMMYRLMVKYMNTHQQQQEDNTSHNILYRV